MPCDTMWAMVKLGVILLACTVSVLVAEFFRRRTRRFPAYGWFGLAVLFVAEFLMFRGVEPIATFFTPIAWTAYALIADAAVFAIRGRSRLRDAPAQFTRLALLSIPLWLLFEAYNLRLANWIYVGGLPLSLPIRWAAFAWAFATIWPGIFLTADLVESLGWWDTAFRPIVFSRSVQNSFLVVGAVFVIVPVILPARIGSYLFGAVWVGFVFLLDPINFRLGLPSFEGDLAAGRPGRFFSFLVSGWVCGLLWEFWNFWAAAKWNYIFPIMQGHKIFEMPLLGYLGFLPFALECFVMYYSAAWLLGWERPLFAGLNSQTQRQPAAGGFRSRPLAIAPWFFFGLVFFSQPAHAGSLHLPDEAKAGLDLLYSAHPAEAMVEFRKVEMADPDGPLGYVLEAEAQWWQIYCESCAIKWNTIDAWDRGRVAGDQDYLDLADRVISISESRIARGDSAEMQLYASVGWMLRTRFLALRGDRRATARAGVNVRTHALRCLALDPQMADAYAGLGFYNYYVDTLSPIARLLRFFMGIPGGSKEEGERQIQIAIDKGDLLSVESRFYLAKSLRTFDHDYARSVETLSPLIDRFPGNPVFHLLMGDFQAKLGHWEMAEAEFRQARQLPSGEMGCDLHLRMLAQQFTSTVIEAAYGR